MGKSSCCASATSPSPRFARSHRHTTGPEIWRQTAGRITHFVAGAGTCGSITGVARYLKEQNPDIKIIAADPEGSGFSGGSGRPYLVEGVGEDFFPAAWEPDLLDDIIAISDEESFLTARYVSEREGILIGCFDIDPKFRIQWNGCITDNKCPPEADIFNTDSNRGPAHFNGCRPG